MAAIGGVLSGSVSIIGGSTPEIRELSLPTANTEYSITYPISTKNICAINDGNDIIEYGYVPGGPYMPLRIGNTLNISGVSLASALTVYFKAPSNNQTVKSEHWV